MSLNLFAQLGYIAQGWFSTHFKVGRSHNTQPLADFETSLIRALPFQIGFQRVLVQSSLHPPPLVIERVLAAADVFAKELTEMPESAIAETAAAFANKMREPDQSIYVKSERIADEVRVLGMTARRWNVVTPSNAGV